MKINASNLAGALIVLFLAGCGQPSTPQTSAAPAKKEELNLLKTRMNDAFAALEMYSVDNDYKYPPNLDKLRPKYLDEIPLDPVSRQPIVYQKTETGFLLGGSGDYSSLEAEKGFPKMNQDGFFVIKEADFPKAPDLETESAE
ncbi:MAG TPA: hypothetical protein EYO33_03235 [Phycisphaerales bacterium]|nr:hypothetical protein [Phycisphaerales bacterium]